MAVELKCERCGGMFRRPKSRAGARFCGKSCAVLHGWARRASQASGSACNATQDARGCDSGHNGTPGQGQGLTRYNAHGETT